MFINSLKASIILTNGYVSFDLINHIFIANKQLLFLKNKRVKAIKVIKTKRYKTLVYYTKAG
jgi:hypothetical protein